MRKWTVDVRFCPAISVFDVEAETAAEAEAKVWDMIDSRTLAVTDVQKAEMMDCLLENIEEVKCYVTGDFP